MLKKILALVVMLYATLAMAAVDVNKATVAELDGVKGVGPVTSKLIMSERKKGEFKSWEDFIKRVKGIGEAKATKLSAEGLTVGGASYKAAATKDAKKDAKAVAKEEKKDAKAMAKDEKKAAEAKKDAKVEKAEAKKDAKEAKAEAKADAAKPAASAAKAASAKK
jgi:competence protein ComEA